MADEWKRFKALRPAKAKPWDPFEECNEPIRIDKHTDGEEPWKAMLDEVRSPLRPTRRAAILTPYQINQVLLHIEMNSNAPVSDCLKFLISHYAGGRVGEISAMMIADMLEPNGQISDFVRFRAASAKGNKARMVPMHPAIRKALERFIKAHPHVPYVCYTKRWYTIRRQTNSGVKAWFSRLYATLGLEGCSSHSGRRGFITRLARMAGQNGSSLADVQRLAGHADLSTTSLYIDENPGAARKLVEKL
jgi:integrase